MKNEKPRIAIVGSGASAFAVAKVLQDFGIGFDVIAPISVQASNENSLEKKLILKDRHEKSFIYSDTRLSQNLNQIGTEILETTFFGGLTEIWGGVVFPNLSPQNPISCFSPTEILDALDYIANFMYFESKQSNLFEVFSGTQTISGGVSGEPTIARNFDGSKWSASQNWKSLPDSAFRKIDGIVSEIFEIDNLVEIKYFDSKREIKSDFYNTVFIAAGPFGNAKIILNSNSNLLNINILDSQTIYTICLGKRKKNIEREMNPEKCFVFEESEGIIYSQIYGISDQLIESIRFNTIKKFLKFIRKIVGSRIFIAMTFLSSSRSDSIIMTKSGMDFIANVVDAENQKGNMRRILKKALWKQGLYAFPLAFIGKPGSGVHSGAFILNRKELARKGLVSAEQGDWENTHFVGTSNFEFIPSGPVTLTSLVHSILVTKEVLNL